MQPFLDYPPISGPDKCLADNPGRCIIERGGESRAVAVEFRKTVPMVLMADSESGG